MNLIKSLTGKICTGVKIVLVTVMVAAVSIVAFVVIVLAHLL